MSSGSRQTLTLRRETETLPSRLFFRHPTKRIVPFSDKIILPTVSNDFDYFEILSPSSAVKAWTDQVSVFRPIITNI